jgi:asparagine synthase (glutamine-hydrolysing)
MCGIVGAVGAALDSIVDTATAERMCRAIRHRGPDDQGIYTSAPAMLGMRRLSIIDLEGGRQPIQNEDGSIWLVFNGEIYNFRELRRDLEARGHVFRSHCDSEAIVHCFEEYGAECFTRLRGMFAIAIWDARDRSLWLARDRLGKKPLYYVHSEKGMAFASEVKALLEVPWLAREVVPEAVWDYLVLGYVPAPGSIFRGVSKLRPGHYLVYRAGVLSDHRYWELAFGPKWTTSEEDLADRLAEILDEAVRIRLVSDVPFGAFLSGGLDSSLVVTLMERHLQQPVKTFSVGFNENEFSELDDARRIARHVGSEHHEHVAEPNAVALLHDLVWYLDEPFGDSSGIPTFLVAQLARSRVKMVLSGDGGDELFAGYDRYQKYRVVRSLRRLPQWLGTDGLRLLGRMIPGPTGRRAQWLAYRAGLPYPDDYLSGVALTTPEIAAGLLGPRVVERQFAGVREAFFDRNAPPGLDQVMAGDIRTYLADDILVKVDRLTMAHSLEARAPLLDHQLVEFAARLPLSLKLRRASGKHLLRAVAQRLLPPASLRKRKHGFSIPLARWLRNDLKELVVDILGSRQFRERGVFDATTALAHAQSHFDGTADRGELLWSLLTFELWARRFVDGKDA